jgi:glycosyltransferase involved in cell wall biosynthesis
MSSSPASSAPAPLPPGSPPEEEAPPLRPTLSVVTPSFNQAAFLPETLCCVRQAAALCGENRITHLIQDNASTDGTVGILQKQRFAQWESTPDHGQAHAINCGWQKAQGDILTYLCSDDLWIPKAIPAVLDAFAQHPEIDVIYGDYYFLEADSGWLRKKEAGTWSRARLLREGNFISQPATFWRRRVYERHGGLDETLLYCLDHEYWLRISTDTTWHYLARPLGVMRLHPDAKTARAIGCMAMESARMQTRYHTAWQPWWSAWNMRLWGCHYYRAKRTFFRFYGKYLRKTSITVPPPPA